MTTLSSKLSLVLPTSPSTDAFSSTDLVSNWNAIDAASGQYAATASAIPTLIAGWGANQLGNTIYDTTNKVTWLWVSTGISTYGLVRSGSSGALGSTLITTNTSFTSGGFATVGTLAVTVPVAQPTSPPPGSPMSRLLKVEAWIPDWTLTAGQIVAQLTCVDASSTAWANYVKVKSSFNNSAGIYLQIIGQQAPGSLTATLAVKGSTSSGTVNSSDSDGAGALPAWISVTEL